MAWGLLEKVFDSLVGLFASTPYRSDLDSIEPFVDHVNYPPSAKPHTVDIVIELLTSGWPWLLCQCAERAEDAPIIWLMQSAQLPLHATAAEPNVELARLVGAHTLP